MCTQVHFVFPAGADVATVAMLVERRKVGRGLANPGREAPVVVAGENAYLVTPWKMCHCGWGSRDFAPVVRDALDVHATPWLGVFVTEQGEEHSGTRVVLSLEEFDVLDEDDDDVLYVVEPSPRPPVVRRHGPRRRRTR